MMGLADLHIHSIHSYDATSSIPAILKYAADHTELNVLAVTDHDSISGVRQAVDLAPHYGLEVIPGCEISTSQGHLIALFIEELIPSELSLQETLIRVGEQGGLCIAPHPTARGTSSLSFEAIKKVLSDSDARRVLVGIEVFNGGLVYTRSNHFTAEAARELPLAQIGSSDAHILGMIGHGTTRFAGTTAGDLRQALLNRTTCAVQNGHLTGMQVIREWLPRYLLRTLGWVSWNDHPQKPLTLKRLSHALTAQPVCQSAA